MVPERDVICHSLTVQHEPDVGDGHVPDGVVEHDVHWGKLEAQFATCLNCLQPIARFRLLDRTQSWFDQWGVTVTDRVTTTE